MKKKIIFGLMGFVSLVAASLANAATVFIDPASVTAAAGDTFTLTIKGSGFPNPLEDPACVPDPIFGTTCASGVVGGSISLTYDPSIVSITGVTQIGLFSYIGAPTLTPGSLDATLSTDFGVGAGSNFDFLAITFTALAPPGTNVNVGLGSGGDWLLADGSVETNVTYTGTSVTIGAVPVPAAVWLFGSGLLGLVGVARRRQVA